MGIEDLKRWHWIVIGLLLGLAISYAWTGIDPDIGRNNVTEFLRDVTLPVDAKTGPIIKGIVIHPPQGDFRAEAALQSAQRKDTIAKEAEAAAKKPPPEYSETRRAEFVTQKTQEAKDAKAAADELRRTANQHQINIVTYKRLMQTRDGKSRQWANQQFIAEIPFKGIRRGGVEAPNISEYLKALKVQFPAISYRYAWWDTTPVQYAMWTGASVIAIGILWPNVLNGLLGAGYGRKREPKAKKESLFGYKSYAERRPEPAKPRVTAADEQRLRDMTEQLERGLASTAARHGDQAGAPVGATPGAIRKLDGSPLDAVPVAKAEDDEIEVKHGQYYDVILHHHKTHSPQQGSPEKPK